MSDISLAFSTWLNDIRYKDWAFRVYKENHRPYLQLEWWANDTSNSPYRDRNPSLQKSRKWYLSPFMTKSEFVQTCFKAVLTAEEHEAREIFTYKGQAIFGPHLDVDALVEFTRNTPEAKRAEPVRDDSKSCVYCRKPLGGLFYGAGDGTGQRFQCAECWAYDRKVPV